MEEQEFYTTELPKLFTNEHSDIFNGKAFATVKNINISDIYPDPETPPKQYTTEELARLAIDILENGLLNPITILAIKSQQKEIYRIISGEKRFRACLLARIEQIPCTVIFPKDEESEIIMPPRNYFDKARIFAEAINRGLYNEETIAKSAEISIEDVHSSLLLLVFTPEEQDLLIKSSVPEASAKKLAKMDSNTRKGFLETIAHGTNVSAVCAKISEASAESAAESEAHFQKTKFSIRSNGFFINTINKAIETMRESGINIDIITQETEANTVLTLTIPKVTENI